MGGRQCAAGDVLDHARAFPVRSAVTSLWNGTWYAHRDPGWCWCWYFPPRVIHALNRDRAEPGGAAWPAADCRLLYVEMKSLRITARARK